MLLIVLACSALALSICAFAVFFIEFFYKKRLFKRIGFLRSEVHKIIEGNYKTKINLSHNDELGLLAKEISLISSQLEAKKAVEDDARAKTNFFALMSHEIRTPLNAIIGLTNIELAKHQNSDTKENLQKINMAGSNLLNNVNDILDFSKIEAMQFDLTLGEYDTMQMISEPSALNLLRIANKPVKFEINCSPELPARLYGDEKHIKQILNNLLSNALKYTKEGRVTLTVDWHYDHILDEPQDAPIKKTTGVLSFIVEDTGIGIKKENLENIFDLYSQTDKFINRNIEGTGLGLYITKKLVNLMFGFIKVTSEYGKGTVFSVEIRQEVCGSALVGSEAVMQLAAHKFKTDESHINFIRDKIPWGRVLVVDDIDINLQVARGMLAPYELHCDCVSGGGEALEAFTKASEKGEQYHIIFMDHLMPKMNGIETTKIIRNNIDLPEAKTVPIIALTANITSDTESFFLENGFTEYLAKPIDVFKLDVILHRFIPERRKVKRAALLEHTAECSSFLNDEFEKRTGIKIKTAMERFGSESVYLLLIQSYCNSIPGLLHQLKEAFYKSNSLSEYAIIVHGIKGAARGICDERSGELAAALELAAKNNDIDFIRMHHCEFCEWMRDNLKIIETALGDKLKHSTSGALPDCCNFCKNSLDTTLLKKIASAAEKVNIEELAYLVQLLNAEPEGETIAEWIKEQILLSNFNEIATRILPPEFTGGGGM